VIAELRKAGSDVSRPTNIRHYLYVPTQRQAKEAATTLRAHGYTVAVHEPLGKLSDGSVSKDWAVIAEVTGVPSLQTFRKSRPLFNQLAAKYHGNYDGWEAAVQK
jgi:regulator of RNase E activity RraB